MRQVSLPLHELAFAAVTRGLAGAGVGLLLADRVPRGARKAIGWTLLGIGAATTAPILVSVIRHSTRVEPKMLPPPTDV